MGAIGGVDRGASPETSIEFSTSRYGCESSIMQSDERQRGGEGTQAFPSLSEETRAGVETDCAAFHLNREPQTLRIWACKQNGPIHPIRINGRLMWPTAELRKLCGVAA